VRFGDHQANGTSQKLVLSGWPAPLHKPGALLLLTGQWFSLSENSPVIGRI